MMPKVRIVRKSDKPVPTGTMGGPPLAGVLSGALLISFSGVWVAIADVSATSSAFYRVFFGFLFLLAATLFHRERLVPLAGLLLPAACCGLIFALDLFFWHKSILYIGPGLATILGNFQVFLIAACGFLFFGEKLKIRFLISLPIAITGLLLVVGVNWNLLTTDYRAGIVYGLLTALCYTIFILLLRNIQGKYPTGSHYSAMMLISLFTALFLALALLISQEPFTIPNARSAFSLVALGLFSQAIGWGLIANSMPHIRPSLTGLVLLLQPSLSFIWDVLFFARPTNGLNWFGTILTLWAIYLGLTGSTKEN